jgi:hypothetical protein
MAVLVLPQLERVVGARREATDPGVDRQDGDCYRAAPPVCPVPGHRIEVVLMSTDDDCVVPTITMPTEFFEQMRDEREKYRAALEEIVRMSMSQCVDYKYMAVFQKAVACKALGLE